jgi:hypothetical protein
MACALNGGYTIDCRDSVGGVTAVWIGEWSAMTVVDSSGTVTGITKATGKRFYKFEIPQAVAETKETGAGDTANGTIFFDHSVTFPLNKRNAEIRNQILVLSQTRSIIVVTDMTGRSFMFGKDAGLWLNAPEGTSGISGADRNGWNLTFSGQQREPAMEVNSAMVAALETAG